MNATLIRHTVSYDRCDDGYNFHVIDGSGEVVDSFRKRSEAIEDAERRDVEVEAEDREERLSSLRSRINDLIEDVSDEATLTAILKMIEG